MNKAFFEREYTCPICLTSFKSLAVRSSAIYVEKREPDFHVIYKGISPLHYSIIICPQCEYAASNNTFNNELNITLAEQLATALAKLKSNKTIDYGAERTLEITLNAFKLAIITAQLKKASSEELGGLLLAAAWIARESNNSSLENIYIEEALKHYVEAFNFTSSNIGNLSDLQVTYLIGELYRRTKNYQEAVSWFNKVISHKNIKQNPNIEKLAREQWALAREEAKGVTYDKEVHDEDINVDVKQTSILKKENSNNNNNNNNDDENEAKIVRRHSTMQFNANLYPDQIEWLKRISNQGYKNNNKLFPREVVLRSIIDFMMEILGDNLPAHFTTEEELIEEIKTKLETRI